METITTEFFALLQEDGYQTLPAFRQAGLKNRPDRFVARYFGYLLEAEKVDDRWVARVGFNTDATLVEELEIATGLKINTGYTFDYPDNTLEDVAYWLLMTVEQIVKIADTLGLENKKETLVGVTFTDTVFENYGERDFMAATVQIQKTGYAVTIPSVGANLGFEFQVPSTGSRIDAVEFDEVGNVITVIECQSGIQHGNYLDDEHFAKAISRYPQSEEIRDTVKKIVVIAGGYTEAQLATFSQLPYEVVVLKTVSVDGKIILVKVD